MNGEADAVTTWCYLWPRPCSRSQTQAHPQDSHTHTHTCKWKWQMAKHHGGDWHLLPHTSLPLPTDKQTHTHTYQDLFTHMMRMRNKEWSTAHCTLRLHRPGYIFTSENIISEAELYTCHSNDLMLCPEYKWVWRHCGISVWATRNAGGCWN